MNAHSLQRAVTRAALACLMACLAMPALAQHAAQQQIIRQQHQDMQHRHSNPQHPGYVGGHSSQQQQPRPMPQPPAAPIRGYEVERSYGALAVGPNGNTYEGLGSTPQEAQAKALDECNYQNLDPHSGGGKPCTAIATVANACLGYAKGWSYGDGGDINYTRFYVVGGH